MKNIMSYQSLITGFLFLFPFLLRSQNQDCLTSFPICQKQTYHFQDMKGIGRSQDLLGNLRCSKELIETNAKWIKWQIEKSGILTFFIDPINESDDIDFVLFRSQKGCDLLEEVRCMASGINQGQPESRSSSCKGQTGLSYQSIDDFESTGCKYDSDNFLKFLSAEKGETYYLLINNYNSKQGFSISFDGDTELKALGDCEKDKINQSIEFLSLLPNPTSKVLNVEFSSTTNKNVVVEIFSIEGKLQTKKEVKIENGKNKLIYDVEKYTSGTYLLRLTQENYSTIRQFVKI